MSQTNSTTRSATQWPRLWITTEALLRFNTYCKYAPNNGEISGLGRAYADQGDIVVDEVLLLEQQSSHTETELDRDALSRFLTELIMQGKDPSAYRLWWHKHPIDGWSTTDEKNIEGLDNKEWFVSLAMTPRGPRARLDLYQPFRVTMDNIQVLELANIDWALDRELKAEVEAKVKKPSYGSVYQQGGLFVQRGSTVERLSAPFNGDKKKEGEGGTESSAGQTSNSGDSSTVSEAEYWEHIADQYIRDYERGYYE